jgi:hypothetical protein
VEDIDDSLDELSLPSKKKDENTHALYFAEPQPQPKAKAKATSKFEYDEDDIKKTNDKRRVSAGTASRAGSLNRLVEKREKQKQKQTVLHFLQKPATSHELLTGTFFHTLDLLF